MNELEADAARHRYMRDNLDSDRLIKVRTVNDGGGHFDTSIEYPTDAEIDEAIRTAMEKEPVAQDEGRRAAPVVQEPVAWRCDWNKSPDWHEYYDKDDPVPEKWIDNEPPDRIAALYAAPPEFPLGPKVPLP